MSDLEKLRQAERDLEAGDLSIVAAILGLRERAGLSLGAHDGFGNVVVAGDFIAYGTGVRGLSVARVTGVEDYQDSWGRPRKKLNLRGAWLRGHEVNLCKPSTITTASYVKLKECPPAFRAAFAVLAATAT